MRVTLVSLLAAVAVALSFVLCGLVAACASVQSPLKSPPVFQSPIAPKAPAAPKAPCETKQVYAPVVPHIDTGPRVCRPGDKDCEVPPIDPIKGPSLPGYEMPKLVKDMNEANAEGDPPPDPSFFCSNVFVLICLSILAVALLAFIWLGRPRQLTPVAPTL